MLAVGARGGVWVVWGGCARVRVCGQVGAQVGGWAGGRTMPVKGTRVPRQLLYWHCEHTDTLT